MNRLAPFLPAVAASLAAVASISIPNADFSAASGGRPVGWTASEPARAAWTPKGGHGDSAAIRVTGDGSTDVRWRSDAFALEPDRCYAFSVWMRGRGSGCVVTGTDHVNVDLGATEADGDRQQYVFRTPPGLGSTRLHLGQWMLAGEVLFDDVALTPVRPVYKSAGELVLGSGEQIDGNDYVFATQFSSPARNHARPLVAAGAHFNTSRWCLGAGETVVYRHVLPSRTWKKGRVSVTCGYYAAGSAEVEVSADGRAWTSLARIARSDTFEADLPSGLLPARELFVRFRGDKPCSLQIYNYAFEAAFDGPSVSMVGSTAFVDEVSGREVCALPAPKFFDEGYGERFVENNELNVWRASSGWKIPRGRALPTTAVDELLVKTAANEAEAVQLVVRPQHALQDVSVALAPGGLKDAEGASMPAGAQIDILRVGYVKVSQPTDEAGCRAAWPDPLLPQEGACPVAAGQNQPFWIRVKPPKGTPAGTYRGVLVVHGVAEDGHAIADVQVPFLVEVFGFDLPDRMTCETSFGFSPNTVARYHGLTNAVQRRTVVDKYLKSLGDHHISPYNPTPDVGWKVRWKGLDEWKGGAYDTVRAAAGRASMRVVDDSTTANGALHYHGRIPLGKGIRIRFRYRTDKGQSFGCCLSHDRADGSWMRGRNRDYRPDSSATEWRSFDETWTGFPKEAVSARLTFYAAGYQDGGEKTGTLWVDDVSVTDIETGRELVEGGDFESGGDPLRVEPVFDWADWDRAMEEAFAKYGFNTFVMRVDGLGGGTYEERHEPSFLGFPASDPAYDVLMGRYLGGIERHLKEKGWLDKALVYWFDEPEPKDYPFVMKGFETLKRHAPGLRRMLTEEAVEPLHGGPNLCCPLTPNLHVPGEKAARAAGDQFWWYVCCGPKAPYVTEFTDHPGTELRLWLWQTWGEDVTGVLIWETTWWDSPNAYPDRANPQNPYEDALSWCASATLAKSPWGNGDGRFLYPPLAAARPSKTPVLAGPVDSYRLEMLRDGLEDYEYFAMLKRLLAARTDLAPAARARYEALLKVPAEVYASLTSFATDPAPMEAHRLKLARAIEELSGRPALQARIDAAARAGGGRVVVP